MISTIAHLFSKWSQLFTRPNPRLFWDQIFTRPNPRRSKQEKSGERDVTLCWWQQGWWQEWQRWRRGKKATTASSQVDPEPVSVIAPRIYLSYGLKHHTCDCSENISFLWFETSSIGWMSVVLRLWWRDKNVKIFLEYSTVNTLNL